MVGSALFEVDYWD